MKIYTVNSTQNDFGDISVETEYAGDNFDHAFNLHPKSSDCELDMKVWFNGKVIEKYINKSNRWQETYHRRNELEKQKYELTKILDETLKEIEKLNEVYKK